MHIPEDILSTLTEEQKSAVERAVKGLSGLEGREVKPC